MNQQTNNEFEKWYEIHGDGSSYHKQKLAWQAARQQPLKRLSEDEIIKVWFSIEHEIKQTIPYGKKLAIAIMDEMERINRE